MALSAVDSAQIRRILEQDPGWSAYALADLDPAFAAGAEWYFNEEAVVLRFAGLDPAVLFMTGAADPALELSRQLPAGPVQFTLLATHRARLGPRLQARTQMKMWRMVLRGDPPAPAEVDGLVRLQAGDVPAIEALMADHPDRPDSFAPFQLDHGIFYGVWRGKELVSMAGTHVMSSAMRVAALGNVFTTPSARGQGLGTATSAAVVQALASQQIENIVLNVSMDNQAALKMYEQLGFHPYCGYYEGIGELLADENISVERT